MGTRNQDRRAAIAGLCIGLVMALAITAAVRFGILPHGWWVGQ